MDNLNHKISDLIRLCNEKSFDQALVEFKSLVNESFDDPILHNLGGVINVNLKNYQTAIDCFSRALKINPNYAEANNNMGALLKTIGRTKDSITFFENAIKIKPDLANAYNNLGASYNLLGEWDLAIKNYNKCLKINPNEKDSFNNLINLLTFHDPQEKDLNFIIKTNSLLKMNNFVFDEKKQINDEQIVNYFKTSNNVVTENLNKNDYNYTEIFRKNTYNLNCKRHFEVFNNFNVIPEFCFSCYKVQVEPKNIIDLLKLYIVFDNLNLKKNNTRKCFIEVRPEIGGLYKGLIYCRGINEAEEIESLLITIIKTVIDDKTPVAIKRGCSEFAISYPKFKDKKNNMQYEKSWKEKEDIIDKQQINQDEAVIKDTINGLTLNDFLIMRNWMMYAKKIGDKNYDKFDCDIQISKYMDWQVSRQLDFRKDEYIKISSN